MEFVRIDDEELSARWNGLLATDQRASLRELLQVTVCTEGLFVFHAIENENQSKMKSPYKVRCIVVHSVLILGEPIQISLHLNLTSASSVEHPSHVKHFLWNGLLRCFTPLSPPTIALVRIEVFSVSHRVMMIMFFAYGTSRLCLKFRFHL